MSPLPVPVRHAEPLVVQILQVQGEETTLELGQGFGRGQAGPNPVARVATRADPLAAPLEDLQQRFRHPVGRRLGVIVDGEVDLVLVAKPRQHVVGIERRFAIDHLDPHFTAEIEEPPAGALLGQRPAIAGGHLDSGIVQALLRLPALGSDISSLKIDPGFCGSSFCQLKPTV